MLNVIAKISALSLAEKIELLEPPSKFLEFCLIDTYLAYRLEPSSGFKEKKNLMIGRRV